MNDTKEQTLSEERIQTSFLSEPERKALYWMAPRLPEWISPDMLTYFGFIGMVMVGAGYYFFEQAWWMMLVANLGLFINWLGDSLDGTLARVRNRQRPKYGYYLDHLIDAFGMIALCFGLAYSGLVSHPFVWIVLSLFFATSINTYLATQTVGVFKISYLRLSTTEARVILSFMNLALIFRQRCTLFGFTFFWLDIACTLIALFLLVAIIRSAVKNLTLLNRQERALWDKQAD